MSRVNECGTSGMGAKSASSQVLFKSWLVSHQKRGCFTSIEACVAVGK